MPRLHVSTFVVLASLATLAIGSGATRAGSPCAPPSQPVDLQNTKCPVTGAPVTAGITDTVNGTVVHFCCTKCIAPYRANPATYDAALRSEPAVALKLAGLNTSAALAGATSMGAGAMPASDKGAKFHDAMRKLWDDHVTWTRLFIVSAAAGLPDQEATTNRLLRNQEDIGNAIKPYYGDEAGTKLTALLKDHITTSAALVGALKANDTAKADDSKKKWATNADEIAAFLTAANPTAWPLDDAKKMMAEHLSVTTDEVAARLKGDWDADIEAYEKVHDQAMKMADMLSDGIRSQFPKKFE